MNPVHDEAAACREAAMLVFGNCDDGSIHPDDADWSEVSFPLDRLIPLIDGGVEGWRQWLNEEIEARELDSGGRSYWRNFLEADDLDGFIAENCDGLCVVSENEDGELQIWDGWHRIASGIIRGNASIELVLGIERSLESVAKP